MNLALHSWCSGMQCLPLLVVWSASRPRSFRSFFNVPKRERVPKVPADCAENEDGFGLPSGYQRRRSDAVATQPSISKSAMSFSELRDVTNLWPS